MNFEDMNIEKSVLDSLNDIGFKTPTTIQCETIPIIKQGNDVIGQSRTGSGKTGAFGIPLVEAVSKNGKLQGLVLAPTRELAKQIAFELEKFSRTKGLRVQTVYGGVDMGPQISGLRRSEIVVGTPGRIIDHMTRGNIDTRNIRMFVLDEADKMIDMGFIDDIEKIERNMPKDRQTLMFSATMSESLVGIAKRLTKNAKRIRMQTRVSEKILKQYYCDIDRMKKFSLLVHLINQEKPTLAIVFCNTRKEVDIVSNNLKQNGINAEALHGGLSQTRREKVMGDFYSGRTKILAATDVAARGLDVKNVTHIFNYSIPNNPEEYVNRIGRTARAGKSGKAISLLSRSDYESFGIIVNKYSYEPNKIEVGDFKVLPFKTSYSYDRRGFSRNNYGRNHFNPRIPRSSTRHFNNKWG